MAVPTRTQTLNTFVTATAENRRPGLIDNFFGSAPLWARLRNRDAVRLDGGELIKENFVYVGMTAASYGRGDTFDTQTKEFSTAMVFNWKFHYAAVNLDVIDIDLNDSPQRVFDLTNAAMDNAEMSLIDDLSTAAFADGSGNAGKDIDGLANGVDQTGTYGGITRGTTANTPQIAIRAGADDTTGGTLALSAVNTQFGNCVVGRDKPDLLVTTQTIWNTIWQKSQPSERNTPEDMRDIGFEAVRFNGSAVTVDSHCPSGLLYLLNTRVWRLYVHRLWDFRFRGFMEPTNQQRRIGQVIWWGNLICRSPRLNGVMSGLS